MEHTENENKAAGAPSALNVGLGRDITNTVVLFIANQVLKIEEEHPLTLEFETDARDRWPNRWAELKAMLDHFTRDT